MFSSFHVQPIQTSLIPLISSPSNTDNNHDYEDINEDMLWKPLKSMKIDITKKNENSENYENCKISENYNKYEISKNSQPKRASSSLRSNKFSKTSNGKDASDVSTVMISRTAPNRLRLKIRKPNHTINFFLENLTSFSSDFRDFRLGRDINLGKFRTTFRFNALSKHKLVLIEEPSKICEIIFDVLSQDIDKFVDIAKTYISNNRFVILD